MTMTYTDFLNGARSLVKKDTAYMTPNAMLAALEHNEKLPPKIILTLPNKDPRDKHIVDMMGHTLPDDLTIEVEQNDVDPIFQGLNGKNLTLRFSHSARDSGTHFGHNNRLEHLHVEGGDYIEVAKGCAIDQVSISDCNAATLAQIRNMHTASFERTPRVNVNFNLDLVTLNIAELRHLDNFHAEKNPNLVNSDTGLSFIPYKNDTVIATNGEYFAYDAAIGYKEEFTRKMLGKEDINTVYMRRTVETYEIAREQEKNSFRANIETSKETFKKAGEKHNQEVAAYWDQYQKNLTALQARFDENSKELAEATQKKIAFEALLNPAPAPQHALKG